MKTLIFQMLIFIGYTGWVVYRWGILKSISESYYYLKQKALFTLFCFALGFPMFTYSRSFYPEKALQGDFTWLFILAMVLCFTGAAANAQHTMTKTIHFAGALISILAALTGLWLQYGFWYLPAAWLIISFCLYFCKKPILFGYYWIWWVEVFAFVFIMAGLLKLNL